MAVDRITIDPDFASRPSREPGKGWAWLMTAAVGVAAFLLGTTIPSDIEATSSTVTTSASTGTTTGSAVPTIPPASSTREMVLLPLPLSDVVPGFTDTVILLETPSPGFNVLRWRASERGTEVALSVARGGASPVGLNASGSLFARVSRNGDLIVTQVPDTGVTPTESEWEGLDAAGVWWHETRPGALAVLSCPRSQPGVAVIHTLEVSSRVSRPIPLWSSDQGCSDEEQGVYLERWDNEGIWIEQTTDGLNTLIFIDADGSETAIDPGLSGGIETFHIDGEWEEISYSPNGTLVALAVYDDAYSATGTMRVVSSESGVVLAEMTEPGSQVFALVWSTDGRFLIFEQWNPDTKSATLVFYDTTTNSITTISILDVVDEIRTAPAG